MGLVQPLPGEGCVSHIIYPHLLFAFLAEHYTKEFELYMSAAPDRLADFWQGFLKTSYGAKMRRSHPVLCTLTIDELAFCVPLIVHGDAAPFSKRRSALFVQWGALLGRRSKYGSVRTFERCLRCSLGGNRCGGRPQTQVCG